jgi:Permease MlaE
MVVTSEIDALRTMALDPIEIVLAPKYVAAMITVPCLTIMSSVFAQARLFTPWSTTLSSCFGQPSRFSYRPISSTHDLKLVRF